MQRISQLIRHAGFVPWLDQDQLLGGQDWDAEIMRALRKTDVVMIGLSTKANSKIGYVQKEVRRALDVAEEHPDGSIFVIPVRLDDCEIPERLRRLHCVDFTGPQGTSKLLAALVKKAEESML